MGIFRHNALLPVSMWLFVNNNVKESIKILGFVLIAIGTLGLLATEYLFSDSDATIYTILFAVFNVVGLMVLAFTHRGGKIKE